MLLSSREAYYMYNYSLSIHARIQSKVCSTLLQKLFRLSPHQTQQQYWFILYESASEDKNELTSLWFEVQYRSVKVAST
jgi:hypothetical protein